MMHRFKTIDGPDLALYGFRCAGCGFEATLRESAALRDAGKLHDGCTETPEERLCASVLES